MTVILNVGTRGFSRATMALLLLLLSLENSQALAGKERPQSPDLKSALTIYHGTLTNDTLTDIAALQASFDKDYQFITAALSREIKYLTPSLVLEGEGQVSKHVRGQGHYEFNVLLDLRWYSFPWRETLATTAAVGAGVSYATDVPEFELANNNGKSDRLLGYLMFELSLGLPARPSWALVARLHHRSGAYGFFENGVRGASNALALGLKYRF